MTLLLLGLYPAARETLADTRRLLEKLIQTDPSNARFQSELSLVLKDLGDLSIRSKKYPEAQADLDRALEIRQALSAALPAASSHRLALSHVLMSRGNLDQLRDRKNDAITDYRRSIALQEKLNPSAGNLYNLACAQASLAHCLSGPEAMAEAERAALNFKKAVETGGISPGSIQGLSRSRPILNGSETFRKLLEQVESSDKKSVPNKTQAGRSNR